MQGRFIVEGAKFVAEIPLDWRVCAYVCSESFCAQAELAALQARAECLVVSDSRFAALSDTVTPQGVLAVCEKRRFALEDIVDKPGAFVLLGEGLSDPGNIGTLIRTAAAAGVDGVVLSQGSGDLCNPKTLRAAAGAALRIPVVEGADLPAAIDFFKRRGVQVLAADLQGLAPYDLDLRQSCALLVGNEAHGLSKAACALADARVKLPMAPGIESLNASVAGGILLYEVVRQRS